MNKTYAALAAGLALGLLSSVVGLWANGAWALFALVVYLLHACSGWWPVALASGPVLTALWVLLIEWDDVQTPGSYGVWPVIRGDLPIWARDWQTPDERLPGGLYESFVMMVYQRYGRMVCSLYWLTRNAMHGFNYRFSRLIATDWMDAVNQPALPDEYPQVWIPLWVLKIGFGWRVKAANPERTTFVVVPFLTIRSAKA